MMCVLLLLSLLFAAVVDCVVFKFVAHCCLDVLFVVFRLLFVVCYVLLVGV